jgi:2-hydroxy-3-keto-5-methylthiopentenyl-1-phosphate phosphatase
MNKFNKVIDKAMDELAEIVANDANVKEYLEEVYGSIVEDDLNLCLIEYIATYYAVLDDIVDRNK